MNTRSGWKLSLVFVLGLLGGFVIFALTQAPQHATSVVELSDDANFDDVVSKYTEIYDLLRRDYYKQDSLDLSIMKEGTVKSFVEAIDDPYTAYFDNIQNDEFVADLEGSRDFEGIGAVVVRKDNGVMIEQVLKGSPAAISGLKPLDVIVKVDGESVLGETLHESVMRIRGEVGSTVSLLIVRQSRDDSDASLLEIDVVREALKQPSVLSNVESVDGYSLGLVSVSVIGEQTDTLFAAEMKKLLDENIDGLILDLRGNGGGFLEEAVTISSWFVPKGELVLRAEYAQFSDDVYRAKGPARMNGLPVVVLVDDLTASSGEIIALALRERAGAKVVGTQTFGKGTVQTLHEFADKTSLKYTVGQWFSPDDTMIDMVGVTPDVVVEFDEDLFLSDYRDNQEESAKRTLVELIQSS